MKLTYVVTGLFAVALFALPAQANPSSSLEDMQKRCADNAYRKSHAPECEDYTASLGKDWNSTKVTNDTAATNPDYPAAPASSPDSNAASY